MLKILYFVLLKTEGPFGLYLTGSGSSSPSYSGVPGSRPTVRGEWRPSEP